MRWCIASLLLCITMQMATANTQIEVGVTSVNSDNITSTASLRTHTHSHWGQSAIRVEIDHLYQSQNKNTTEDRWETLVGLTRPISSTVYLQTNARFDRDRFDSHQHTYVVDAGLGIRLIDRSNFGLTYELAPGYQIHGPQRSAIVANSLSMEYHVTAGITATNDARLESGSNDTYLKNISAITAELTDRLHMVVDHTVRRTGRIDRITAIKLGISF